MGKDSSPRPSGTPALVFLNQHAIEHRVHAYEHDPRNGDFGREAASALSIDPETVLKTLVWQVDDALCLAVIPVAWTVAPKKLAAALGARRAQLATVARAERLSGSVVGAISPIAMKNPVTVVLDDSALAHERVFVSAGRRGLEIEIAPGELARVTDARIASIIPDR